MTAPMEADVLELADVDIAACADLLRQLGLKLKLLAHHVPIPGSFWGERKAGLIGSVLYCREDTPVHSLLHEACHFVCMDAGRRAVLERDAGGGHDEENAVCYLQIVLADSLPAMGATRMLADMDAWGYGFRLGSARAWFEKDAGDARTWLTARELIDRHGTVTWRVRTD